jgi:HTH-type transcriptional regulator / antitoxin HigA
MVFLLSWFAPMLNMTNCALTVANGFESYEGIAMNTDRPIRTETDYAAAAAEVKRLWGAEPGTAEGDRLDLLLVLVSAYEDEHDAIVPPDPIDAILERMDNLGMTRADLGAMLGGATSGRVSEILNRRRPLTIDMIRKLVSGLGLSEHCLLQKYELARQFA